MAVAIPRTELSAEKLRGAARWTRDRYQARRLLALVRDGASRMAAAGHFITVAAPVWRTGRVHLPPPPTASRWLVLIAVINPAGKYRGAVAR